ncbi:MAG TPA: hypothetical protein VGF14_01920 [Alphaproteobacteria bacterium]
MKEQTKKRQNSKEFNEFFAEMGKSDINNIDTEASRRRLEYYIGKIEAASKPDPRNQIQFTI